jgi:hypothetical protein
MRWARGWVAIATNCAVAGAFFACTSFGDASNDAVVATPDGSASDSASADGGDAADATFAKMGFCTTLPTPPTSCVDFEDGTLSPSPWTNQEVGGARSTLVEECGQGSSKRCALIEGVGPVDATSVEHGAALRFSPGGSLRTASIAASVRVQQISGGSSDVLSMSGGNGTDFWTIEIEIAPDGSAQLAEYEFPTGGSTVRTTANATRKLSLQSWERVELTLTVKSDASSALVRFGSELVAEKPVKAHAYGAFRWIEVGDRRLDSLVTSRVRFDDIVVQISP